MAELNETPRANRVHVAFFGLRNAGKSTLVNAFTGQDLAIVSDTPGTTTDPVSKAMEILPLGPCLVTDTAGLDDVGELGALRVRKTLGVLATADIAVWVAATADERPDAAFLDECRRRAVPVIEFHRGDDVEELRRRVAAVCLADPLPGLLDGLVKRGDRVLCVCPIDESAPKGRLILPQQQVIRECLEKGIFVGVVQPDGVTDGWDLVIADSQAFREVSAKLPASRRLTSFSILFARQKGDLKAFLAGMEALKTLADGDLVAVAEGCTHHRQCNDIGTVKIPAALRRLTGRELRFEFFSGGGFVGESRPKLVVQCGGCMLTRREMLRRIALAADAGIPIVNYGMVLAAAAGVDFTRA